MNDIPRGPSRRRTTTIAISPDSPDPDAIGVGGRVLRAGGLVAFATETVYGLGADATSSAAVATIFAAKGRPSSNPLIVHVDSLESARPIAARWTDLAERVAEHFWPGPLSLVLPGASAVADNVTAGGSTVAIRVPRPRVARDLIASAGRPIAAPSANRSLGISPTLARHVAKDLGGRIDLILDSGPTSVGLESTVLDLTTDPPVILRPGSITPEDLAPFLGQLPQILGRRPAGEIAKGPGMSAVHYAPRTPTFLVSLDDLPAHPDPERTGLLIVGEQTSSIRLRFAHRIELLTPHFAQPALYDSLHRLDEMGLDAILVVPPDDTPPWHAVSDRLVRAARRFSRPALFDGD